MVASDGRKAVELVRENAEEIALVIMDVVMPLQGGLQSYPELVAIKPDIEVIFTSGYADEAESLTTHLEKGMKFLQKPYSLPTLSQFIRNALEHKRKI
jgi:DNA-binding NtrC family response regulator